MVFPPGCGFEATDAARRMGGELALGGCRSCIIRRLSGGRLGYLQSPPIPVPALVPATGNRWDWRLPAARQNQ